MARIRTIKPEFWKNEELAAVSAEACLLAIGLLNYCDDEGYFNANPALVKAAIFPIRKTSSIDTVLLRELSSVGYIELFSGSDNRKYGRVTKFNSHQVINKPSPSKIKGLCDLPYNYGNDTGGLPSGKERKGKESIKENRPTLETLSTSHIESWLKEKRAKGIYLKHDENFILEIFKDYCKSKNKIYTDYVAAYRGAFTWEKCQPKERYENNRRGGGNHSAGGRPSITDAIESTLESVRDGSF